jgi:hypothetical protein
MDGCAQDFLVVVRQVALTDGDGQNVVDCERFAAVLAYPIEQEAA